MQDQIHPGAMPFWMLNDAATIEQQRAFLERCHAGGIRALTMHCRAGNLIPYASDAWFEAIRAVVVNAARLGMQIWLYDEDPYPSGAAGGMVMAERPDLYARCLSRHEPPPGLAAGDLWFISENRVLWAGLVPDDPAQPTVDLLAAVGTVRADWFTGPWDSRYYYEETPYFPCPRGDAVRQRYTMRMPAIPAGHRLVAIVEDRAGVDGSWNGLPDLLNFDTFEVFRRLSLDRYASYVGEFYGNTIPGIFTDEPKYHGVYPVTRDLFESFRHRYGYDLQARLYQLFGEARSEAWERTRIDYRRWLGERFLSAFVDPYRRYCEARQLHLVGHLSPEDDPICEAVTVSSQMAILRTMGWPGVDVIVPYVGTADCPTLNLGSLRAGAIRSQTDAPFAISETLALTDWDVTSRLSRHLLAWQKVLGIDRFFFHGFFASTDGVTRYEAPPDYGPNSPIFPGIATTNDWLKRLDGITDGATDVAEVAILDSMIGYLTVGDTKGSERQRATRRHYWRLLLNALRAQVGFQLADERDVANAKAADGCLCLGLRRYRVLVVPDLDLLPAETFAAIAAAARAGVRVLWCGDGPRRLVDDATAFLPVPELPGELIGTSVPDEAWCRAQLPRLIALGGPGAEDVYARRLTDRLGAEHLLLVNSTREAREIVLPPLADGGRWLAAEVDGTPAHDADGTRWQIPGGGFGRFVPGPAATAATAWEFLRETGAKRRFQRHGANLCVLQRVTVLRPDRPPVELPSPRTYSFIYDDYRATQIIPKYMGDIPVLSTVAQPDVAYVFRLRAATPIADAALILEARTARGCFDVILDGATLATGLRLPLADTSAKLRIAFPTLAPGDHELRLAFQMESAMEGILVPLFVEGDFAVELTTEGAVLSAASSRDSAAGWTKAGLPFYMGEGSYEWVETLSAAEAALPLALELDDLVDSGELTVNGASHGRQAWPPFRWPLTGLKAGENRFVLRVSSTAGNAYKLDYPEQAQGWLGQARLVRRR